MLNYHVDLAYKLLGWEVEQSKSAKCCMKFMQSGGNITENPQDVERPVVGLV